LKDNQQELFIVVGKNDRIISYRTRYDCHHDKSLIHRAIGIIIYNDEGEILLQKRSILKDLQPGMYDISVGGHVTKGQSYKEAALREMREELGIQTKITMVKKFLSESDEECEMDMLFTARYNGPFFIATDEIQSVKFFNKREIKNMKEQLTPFAKNSLEQINIL
jgi:isopentenyl-diphosphate delta-isomerase type 1